MAAAAAVAGAMDTTSAAVGAAVAAGTGEAGTADARTSQASVL